MRIVDAMIVTMILLITAIISYFVSLAIMGPVGDQLGTLSSGLPAEPAALITNILSSALLSLGLWIVLIVVALVVYFYLEATKRETVTGYYGGVQE